MTDQTANEQLLFSTIRRVAHRLRYSNGLAARVITELRREDKELGRLVLDFMAQLEDRPLHTPRSRQILKSLDREARALRKDVWTPAAKLVRDEIQQFALDQVKWKKSLVEAAIPLMVDFKTPDKDGVINAVMNTPVEGVLLNEWLARAEERDAQKIVERVTTAVTQDLPAAEARRQIVGVERRNYKGSHVARVWQAVQGMAQTLVAHAQTASNDEIYRANDHIFEMVKFVATLDSRTTPICQHNDGGVHKYSEAPKPPLHIRCRSVLVPWISADLVGDRPYNPTTERQLLQEFTEQQGIKATSRANLPHGTKGAFDKYAQSRKRQLIGSEPDNVDYGEFFKKQSKTFREDVVGIKRNAIMEKHGLPLNKVIGSDGDYLTIDELAAKGYRL